MRRPSADCPRRPSLPAQLHRQHFVKALLLGAAAALLVVLGAAAVVEGPGHGLHALHLHLQRQAGQAAPRPAISPAVTRSVERLVARWAPLVWLSPGERFMPAGVEDFLQHVTPRAMAAGAAAATAAMASNRGAAGARAGRAASAPSAPSATPGVPHHASATIPQGPRSAAWYLVSNASVEELLGNSSSFLYGRDPSRSPVPVYAVVTLCDERRGKKQGQQRQQRQQLQRDESPESENEVPDEAAEAAEPGEPGHPPLHVTYWMFFPYNEGKPVCVLDLGPLGPWPLPLLWGSCLGTWRRFGAHVGDWEHVSLFFSGENHPDAMYVSTHEAGGFYRWSGAAGGTGREGRGGHLVLERQEVRKGSELLQRASFPPLARLHRATGRPELFAAQGSHGLWTRPGSHRYVRVPRLYDHSGYGVPWRTWERLAVLYEGESSPSPSAAGWLRFLGRWGNPRAGCHPLSAAICAQTDGPTGIPLKGRPFSCPAPAPAAAAPAAPASKPLVPLSPARPPRRLHASPRR